MRPIELVKCNEECGTCCKDAGPYFSHPEVVARDNDEHWNERGAKRHEKSECPSSGFIFIGLLTD